MLYKVFFCSATGIMKTFIFVLQSFKRVVVMVVMVVVVLVVVMVVVVGCVCKL